MLRYLNELYSIVDSSLESSLLNSYINVWDFQHFILLKDWKSRVIISWKVNPLKKKIIWSLIRIDISLWMFLKVEQKHIKIDYWYMYHFLFTLWIWLWAGQQVHCEESCRQCWSHSQPGITGVRQRRVKLGARMLLWLLLDYRAC